MMADKTELLLEAERRGLLPPDKAALLKEARLRGLMPQQDEATIGSAIETVPNVVPSPVGNEAPAWWQGTSTPRQITSMPINADKADIEKHPELQGMAFPSALASTAYGSMIGKGAKGITVGAEDLLAKGMNAIVDNPAANAIAAPVINFLNRIGGSGRIANLAGGEAVAREFSSPEAQLTRKEMVSQGVQGDVSQMLPRTMEGTLTVEGKAAQESMNKLFGMDKTAKSAEKFRSKELADAFNNLENLTSEVGGKTRAEAGQAYDALRAKHGSWSNPEKVAAANESVQEQIAKRTVPLVNDLREFVGAFDEMVSVKAPEEAKAILKNLSFKKQTDIERIIKDESSKLMPDMPVVQSNNTRQWLVDRLKSLKNQQSLSRDEIAQIKFLANKLSDFRKVPNADVSDWLHTMQGIGKESYGGKIPYSLYTDMRKAMLQDASESSQYYRARGFSVGDIGKETDAAIGGYRDSFKRQAIEDLVTESSVKDAAGNPMLQTLDAKAFRKNLVKNKDEYASMFSPEVVKKLDKAAEVAERIQEIPSVLKPADIRTGEFATTAGRYRAVTGTLEKFWDSLNADARLKIMTTPEGQDRLLKVGEALRKQDAAGVDYGRVGLQKWLEGYMGAKAVQYGILGDIGKVTSQQKTQEPIQSPANSPLSMFGPRRAVVYSGRGF